MARSRDVGYYPEVYADTVRKVAGEFKIARVAMDSRKEGERLRGQFYAYVNALKLAEARLLDIEAKRRKETEQLGKPVTYLDPLLQDHADLARLAARVMIQLNPKPTAENPLAHELVYQRRDASWQATKMAGVSWEEEKSAAVDKFSAGTSEMEKRLATQYGIDLEASKAAPNPLSNPIDKLGVKG